MLRQQDVGHRIVVRRIVGIREGRPQFSDALGELVELSETHLTLATAQGPLRVPVAQVHRAKRVPPTRRPTAAAVVALERAADEAWPAPTRGRLGDWLLRSAEGWTGRANSALPIGDPDRPLAAAVDAVERWYAERGQPALINTPLPLAAPVGAELDARGWGTRPPTLVQTAPLPLLVSASAEALPADLPATANDAANAPADGWGSAVVELAAAPSDEWLAIAAGRKGGLPDAARHVLTAVDQVRFAHVYADNALVAVGRGTVTGQGRWLGLSLIEVVPTARRQGLARRVIHELVSWGASGGATHAFLQVEQRNTAAVALYQRLGFTTHHTYLTRVAPH
ncbi:GNAT family N-acetyltransferase [Micromonospora saelicesensis]|uniref:Ribosomal-protein-alanine N-acetyltransferase n=1 Tax=Micromonospora saelicesensis TaxID=285676 RepID=A0ABX9CFL0_9ACTN|nr:GNAT family N-acetyltransferase [Micromonospora saelicesensis]RAN96033.1 Ribosomal-protein-alanine N-acetyltransferase [Micromonospora saelicesensis]RAO54362.1 Ribosomal-protein-alanine N-acetyltransferase [Micromonospora saelicesensis]